MDSAVDIMHLCRLCLVKEQVNIPIFEDQGNIRQIFLKINSCLQVKVSRNDNLPKNICDGCTGKLDLLYDFWNTSSNAEKTLLSWLGEAGYKKQDNTKLFAAQQIHHDSKEETKQKKNKKDAFPPPPKGACLMPAVKDQSNISRKSDDDDDMDMTESLTTTEYESESHADPGTSTDDEQQHAGLVEVGKNGEEAPIINKEEVKSFLCYFCSKQFQTQNDLAVHCRFIKTRQFVCPRCSTVVVYQKKTQKKNTNQYDHSIFCHHCINPIQEIKREIVNISHCLHDLFIQSPQKYYIYETHIHKKLIMITKKNFLALQTDEQQFHLNHTNNNYKQPLMEDTNQGKDQDSKGFSCEICNEEFLSKKELNVHNYRKHIVKTKHVCWICGFSTLHQSSFYIHFLRHKNKKKFLCSKCPKRFNISNELRKHLLVHAKVKRHMCEICSKAFKRLDSLNVHLRIHQVVKPFACSVCNKTFTTKQWRDSHLKSHKPNKK